MRLRLKPSAVLSWRWRVGLDRTQLEVPSLIGLERMSVREGERSPIKPAPSQFT